MASRIRDPTVWNRCGHGGDVLLVAGDRDAGTGIARQGREPLARVDGLARCTTPFRHQNSDGLTGSDVASKRRVALRVMTAVRRTAAPAVISNNVRWRPRPSMRNPMTRTPIAAAPSPQELGSRLL